MSEDEARNAAISAERLEELSADPALRGMVASNPSAPASLLETLARDQDAQVRAAVASNPNTLWKILEHLAWEFPHAFLHNPIGPLQLMTYPEQLSTDSVFWEGVLREAPIPPLWWNWLNSQSSLSTREMIRMHVQHAGEVSHPFGSSNNLADAWDLLTLVQLLTAACAQRVSLPTLKDPTFADQSVKLAERIIGGHLQWLADCFVPSDIVEMTNAIAAHALTPVEVLRSLANSGYESNRVAVAGNRQTPQEVLQTLAQDGSKKVREAVATNGQAPMELLLTLAQDQEAEVRRAVARHAQAPVAALRALAQDPHGWVRMGTGENAQVPEEVVRMLAHDENAYTRRAVARHAQVSAEVLLSLARDENVEVRRAVAANTRLPGEALLHLTRDADAEVRRAVAGHAQIPSEVLLNLARDKDASVRRAVAEHVQAPAEALLDLASDQEDLVRGAVAWHARTPMEILLALAQDTVGWVRGLVAWNRQTPVETLRALAQDEAWDAQSHAKLVLGLMVEDPLREQEWWEKLRGLLRRVHEDDQIVVGLLDEQLANVAKLDLTQQMHQTIIATLAAEWDAQDVRFAFKVPDPASYGQDFLAFLSMEQKHYQHILAPFMPPIALQKLATCPRWEVRYLVALHEQTPWETRQRLSQDGNRYVRAMARAKAAQMGEQRTD